MGYFLDYENSPCYRCGESSCNGDCENRGVTVRNEPHVTHFENGFGHLSCDCFVCQEMRARQENRARE